MKKILFFGAFALFSSGFALGASVTITNSGLTFSPDNVTISIGDTVKFQLSSIHNALEVSEATWNGNGNTPLPDGFDTPFGNSELTGLTAGVHYYVCSVHFNLGMKGKITVNGPSGINDNTVAADKINIYPNPTSGKFTVQFNRTDGQAGNWLPRDEQAGIEIYNIVGEKIDSLSGITPQSSYEIDISSLPDGIYFVRINDRKSIYTRKIIKG